MSTVQNLKKKLQVIKSTRKITQAMKTASTVKYSRLSGIYAGYNEYEKQCRIIYESYKQQIDSIFSAADENAPACYIVISSNKGMCGSFNSELLSFFKDIYDSSEEKPLIISCGKQARDFFERKNISVEKAYIFEDIPDYSDAQELFSCFKELMNKGKISSVSFVYPSYTNMIKQTPVCDSLFSSAEEVTEENLLFIPDKETVIKNTGEKILISTVYKKLLETALGAQAATLTTMRTAYDTACEYCAQLETEINRKRQSQVTADVIEVAAEFSKEGEI